MNPSVIKSKLSNSLKLGIIRHCNNGFTIGVIQTWDSTQIYRFYIFNKATDYVLSPNTLVVFSTHNQEKQVNYVTPLDSLKVCHDWKTSLRDNGFYYSDPVWKNMLARVPFVDYEQDRLITIYIPEDNSNKMPFPIIQSTLSGLDKHIFELYMEIKRIEDFDLNYINLSKFISEKQKYIDSLSIPEIVSQFKAMRIERLERRLGRDDHYYVDYFQTLPFEDSYLRFLLPTKTENISFDNNWTSSDEDNSGVYLLENETKKLQEEALKRYSKIKHLSFLIDEKYRSHFEGEIKKTKILDEIYSRLGRGIDNTSFYIMFDDLYIIKELNKTGHY